MKYLFHGLFIIFSLNATGQNTIPYLIHEPVIDGYADEMQPGFRLQAFKTITKSNPNNPDITAGYYLAHNEKFLYLYLEAHADSLIVRDRGYQNGDGFHFLIGKPQKNNEPTDEFYVLGFSAGQSWSRKMIWYYNIDLQMQRLSRDTKFETGCKNGKISFELLLPWKEVHPYHPWFSVSAGFNICFVKAIGEKERNYYFMEYDNRFQSEQSKKKYRVCHFEKPEHIPYRCSSMLSKCHISKNENPVVRLACFTTDDTSRRISITIASGENATVVRKSINLNFRKGFNELEIPVDNGNLIPGGYRVEVFSGEQQADRHYFSVFPDVYPENTDRPFVH